MTRKRILGVSFLLAAGVLALIIIPAACDARIVSVSASTYWGGTAIDANGSLWKWGTEGSGMPGQYAPYIVPGISNVKATYGEFYTLILESDGTVWMMDYVPVNGNGHMIQKDPVKLEGVSNITAIACDGDHWIALKDDGTVWAWDPVLWRLRQINGLNDVQHIAMGEFDSYAAVKKDGTVWTWGNNGNGQLGDGTYSWEMNGDTSMPGSRDMPMPVPGLTNVTQAAAGCYFMVALKDDGTVWAWGNNQHGILGDGMPEYVEEDRPYPGQVAGLSHIVAISAGTWFASALRDDGTVWTWGGNGYDATIGDGTFDDRNLPVMVKNLTGVVQISSGNSHTLALDVNGTIWGWGRNDDGQLGNMEHKVCGFEDTAIPAPFSVQLSGQPTRPSWMVPSRPSITPEPEQSSDIRDNDSVMYMTSGDDGTLYVFTPAYLIAYDSSGNQKWNLSLPGQWMYDSVRQAARFHFGYQYNSSLGDGGGVALEKATPTIAVSDGYIYMYLLRNVTVDEWRDIDYWFDRTRADTDLVMDKELVAISPDGNVAWTYSFKEERGWFDRASIEVKGGKIYFFHGYNETVLDRSGRVLFAIENISDPVAVAEDGTIYAFTAVQLYWDGLYQPGTGKYFDFRLPGTVLNAYDGNGRMIWSKDIGVSPFRESFGPSADKSALSLPIYSDGRLYVPIDSGVIALDRNGDAIWSRRFDDGRYYLLDVMPVDQMGNLYLYKENLNYSMVIRSIDADGNDRSFMVRSTSGYSGYPLESGHEGIIYEVFPVKANKSSVSDLDTVRIGAIDVASGSYLWNYTVPLAGWQTTTANRSNVKSFFGDGIHRAWGNVGTGLTINGYADADVIPTGDLSYVNFRAVSYEYPIVFGRSNITYANAIYAIDRDGKVVWQKSIESFGMAWTANNTTVFYAGNDGKINVAIIGLAAVGGLTLLAGAYLALKYFLFGTVTRGRTRLDENDNRKQIAQFIIASPGVTQYEIARQTGINMGTVRYHLLILKMNHKIRTFKEGKFIRYFPNSHLYSPEELLAISLMRREPLRGIVGALLEKPGLTNADLRLKLSLSDVAISDHTRTLYDHGVISREKTMDGRLAFRITPAFAAIADDLKDRNVNIISA